MLIDAVLLGVGATVFMDMYALIIRKFWNIPSLDYRILGRWIGHFKDGKFCHSNIIQTTPIQGEQIIGWTSHYLIGITFAYILLLIWDENWLVTPTILPPVFIGLATTLAPWFMMQPAFGFGFAASKLPNPALARFRSLQAHLIYGIGLYLTGLFISILFK